MKINGEYPKFYMRVEGKRYAAISNRGALCSTLGTPENKATNCSFLFKEVGDCESNFICTENKVIYVKVPEE